MKRKLFYILFSILTVLHFLMLYYFGIAALSTTILFYILLFLFFKRILRFYKNRATGKIILHNIKTILLILFFFELIITFVFTKVNSYSEKETGVYFSAYMKNRQKQLLTRLGYLATSDNTYENGYGSTTSRHHRTREFDFPVSYNSIGLRGSLPPVRKDSNEYRIAVIGDSFAEGYGADADSTFPCLLEKKLRASASGRKISVLNGGICGSNPYYAIKLYARLLAQYHPDLVILEINNSDLADYDIALHQGDMPVSEYFYSVSHIYRVIKYLIDCFDLEKSDSAKRNLDSMTDLIKDFKETLNKNDQQFTVVYLPFYQEIYDRRTHTYSKIILNHLTAKKIPFTDLQNPYRSRFKNHPDSIVQYYWPEDGHHNARGYNLMADLTYNMLKDKIQQKQAPM